MRTDKKVKTIAQCKAIAKEQDFKHARLLDIEGGVIVAYNPAHNRGSKITLEKKLKEIETRLKSLPGGIYIIEYRARFSGNEPTYKYYIGNKTFDASQLQDEPEMPTRQPKVAAQAQPTTTTQLLSVERAMEYATENARLSAEVDRLRDKVTDLQKEVAELTAELDAIDDKEMSEPEVDTMERVKSFAESAGQMLLPVLDRYMDLKEKKINLERDKFLAERGMHPNGGQQPQAQKNYWQHIPTPDDDGWEDYLEWCQELSDRKFNKHLALVEQANAQVYQALCDALGVTFEEEEEEEEQEPGQQQ